MAEDPLIDITKVTDKGQVVIPKDVRDRMGYKEGTRLIVMASGDAVVLQKVETVAGRIRMKDLMDRIKAVTSKLGLG